MMPRVFLICLFFGVPASIHAQDVDEAGDAVFDPAAAESFALPPVLDLDAAQRIALANNPSLSAAMERVEQAAQRVKQTRAEWFPSVDASIRASATEIPQRDEDAARRAIILGTATRIPSLLFSSQGQTGTIISALTTLRSTRQGLLGIDDTIETWQESIDATWTLFDGLGRRFRIAAAKFGRDQSEAAQRESQRLVLSAVAFAFHGVQLARENVAISQADKDFNLRQLTEAEARQRAGAGSLSDVLNFQIRVKAAESSLLATNGAFRVALIGLAELMGLEDAELEHKSEIAPLLAEGPDEMQAIDAESLIGYADENRPDVAQARAAADRAGAIAKVQRGQFFPRVDAFASRDATRDDSSFGGDDFSSTIGVSVNYSIAAGGRRIAAYKEARAADREAGFSLEGALIAATADVRQAAVNLETSQRELLVQRETTELVERNRELVEKEYRAGQGSLVRLNEAQRDLIAQQSRLALARVALRQSWHDLRTATAETLEGLTDPDSKIE